MQTEWLGDSVSERDETREGRVGKGTVERTENGESWDETEWMEREAEGARWEHVSHTEIVNYSFVHAGSVATSRQANRDGKSVNVTEEAGRIVRRENEISRAEERKSETEKTADRNERKGRS